MRQIKSDLKTSAKDRPDFRAATFDLQQVIHIPKSNRSEIFYKRRLACYNFTVFELASKQGHCFFWHEAQAKRGANEICSHLYRYLVDLDANGIKEAALFADGCAGQNKNSIMPAMLMYVTQHSQHLKVITLYFYETSHGQSEGDSMHSTIERMMGRSGDLFIPDQVKTILRVARKTPYVVHNVETKDIKNWKEHSVTLGILRNRTADDGLVIDWTKIKQVQVDFHQPTKIFFKHTHDPAVAMSALSLRRRGDIMTHPALAYTAPPNLPRAKYDDLKALSSGQNPVVVDPAHQRFYGDLPH